MKLERIPKYRIPLTDKSELTIERAEEGWHLTTDTGPFGSDVLYVPHAAVGLLVEALTTDDRKKGLDEFLESYSLPQTAPVASDLGSSQGTSLHKAIWTYSPYRATLYRDGERFAMVTPDGSNALPSGAIVELLAALNGSEPVFDKVVDSPPKAPNFPDIAPDPGYRKVEVDETIQSGDLWKYDSGATTPVSMTVGQPLERSTTVILQRRDPDAVAAGHNPGKLTNAQVGVYDSWRLATEEEKERIGSLHGRVLCQMWRKDASVWSESYLYFLTDIQTFRTKAEKLEVVP